MPTGLGLYDLVEKLFLRAKRKEEEWTAAAIASLGLAHPCRASLFFWHHLFERCEALSLNHLQKGKGSERKELI